MPRVALIHDFLLDLRGGERVFAAICDAYPEADVFTAVYDERGTEGRFAARRPTASYLQRLRPTARTFRPLLPFYPSAIESLDLRGYEIVVSSSSAWSHGVLVDPGAVHVCYCHNPFRYAWNEREATLSARNFLTRVPLRALLSRWRQWDWIAAQRVDTYIANSAITAARIRRYFGRESTVLHPPVELGRFSPGPVGAHYLVLAELMAHKRIDVAVRAFNALGLPLVVVGDGPESRRLRRMAGPTVRLTGRLSDDEVADLLRTSQALIVTAEEEFGIAAVESLASGRPVIALRSGGVLETVSAGRTGAFYDDGDDPQALAAVVRAFDPGAVDPAECVAAARRFGVERFQERLRAIVDETVRQGTQTRATERPVGGLLPRRASRRGAESMRIR
jgi:glycosyltransferase involved in cell wall biosynthesis